MLLTVSLSHVKSQVADQRAEITYNIANALVMLGVIWMGIFAAIGAVHLLPLTLAVTVLLALVPVLGRRGNIGLARFTLITIINGVIAYYAVIFGAPVSVQLAFIPLVTLPLVINPRG